MNIPKRLSACSRSQALWLLSGLFVILAALLVLAPGEILESYAFSIPQSGFTAGEKPAIILKGKASGSTIRPGVINGAYRAIGTGKNAAVSDVTIDGLQATVQRDCIRLRGDRLTVRNVHCSMLAGPKRSMHDLPEGIHVEAGNGITIENSSFDGFQMVLEQGQYWNGDGVAAERGVTGLLLRNVTSDNNTDAGFDIKPPVRMDRVSASGNCRNYRFWSDADLGTISVGDVARRGGSNSCFGIWILGSRSGSHPKIRIRNLVVTASRPLKIVKVAKGAADIMIDHCVIRAPAGTTLIDMKDPLGRIALDRSCRLN